MTSSAENQPRVSVIVPVYNASKYLVETISSVRRQTLRDLEIIIVDDGSTDESVAIAEELASSDARIQIFALETNQGVGAARNFGIQQATGEFLYFLDSDDRLHEEALEVLSKKSTNEQLDILYFDAEPFFDSPQLEREKGGYRIYYQRSDSYLGVKPGVELLVEMTANDDWKPGPPLQLARRSFIEEEGVTFPEGTFHEDNPYTLLNALAAKRVAYEPRALLYRRIREGSIVTSRPTPKHIYGLFDAYVQGSSTADRLGYEPSSREGQAIDWEIRKLADDAQRKHARLSTEAERAQVRDELGSSFAHRDIAELSQLRAEVAAYRRNLQKVEQDLLAIQQRSDRRPRSLFVRALDKIKNRASRLLRRLRR